MLALFSNPVFIIVAVVIVGILLLVLASYTPLVALYFGLLAPIIGAATSFASSVILVARSAIAAAPAAVVAAYGMGMTVAANAAASLDAFVASVVLSNLGFGIVNRTLALLDLVMPYFQIQSAMRGVYSKGTLFLLIVGIFFGATVFLDIFPFVQTYVNDAYCVIGVFLSYVDAFLRIIGKFYDQFAPLLNELGAWVYDLASAIIQDLLIVLTSTFSILIRISNDPASLAIAPSHTSCVGYQSAVLFPSSREQLVCLGKDILRFGVDGVVLRIFSALPGVDNTAQSLAHEIVWLFIDALTRGVQFLAQVIDNPGGCTDPSDCYKCSLGNPDMETCCPIAAMLCVIKRFFALGSRVGFLLYQLIIQIPVIGDVIRVVAELASLLAEILNKYIRKPFNDVLNIILQPIGDFINGLISAICVFLHIIDDVIPGDLIPDDSHCGIGFVNIPLNPIPEIPLIAELQVNLPPILRRRRMLNLDDPPPYDVQAEQARMLREKRTYDYWALPEYAVTDADSWGRVPLRAQMYQEAFMEWLRVWALQHQAAAASSAPFGATYTTDTQKQQRKGDFGCYATSPAGHSNPTSGTISATELTAALEKRARKEGIRIETASERADHKANAYYGVADALHLHPDMMEALRKVLRVYEEQNATRTFNKTTDSAPTEHSSAGLVVRGHDEHLNADAVSNAQTSRQLKQVTFKISGLFTFIVHVFTTAISAAATGLVIITKWVLEVLVVLLDVLPAQGSSTITVTQVVQLDPLIPARIVRLALTFFLDTLGSSDVYGTVDDINLDAQARAIQRWGNTFARRVMGAFIKNAELLLQTLAEALLNLRLTSLTGFIGFLYSKVECDSPSSYHPFRNPTGTYRLLCLTHLLIPPKVPVPLITIPKFIDWGVPCLAPALTCQGSFGPYIGAVGECIPCQCPPPGYTKCDTVFPTGMHLLSGLLSGTLEWAVAIVDGTVSTIAGEHLTFTMVDVINLEIPFFLWIPGVLQINIGAVRPVALIPLFEQFLRLGLDADGRSIARSAFPGVHTVSSGVPAAFACVIVAFPSVTWHLFVVLGWLGLYFAVLPVIAAASFLTASVVFLLAVLLFSLLYVLFASLQFSAVTYEMVLLGETIMNMGAISMAQHNADSLNAGVTSVPVAPAPGASSMRTATKLVAPSIVTGPAMAAVRPPPPPPPTRAAPVVMHAKGKLALTLYGGRRRGGPPGSVPNQSAA